MKKMIGSDEQIKKKKKKKKKNDNDLFYVIQRRLSLYEVEKRTKRVVPTILLKRVCSLMVCSEMEEERRGSEENSDYDERVTSASEEENICSTFIKASNIKEKSNDIPSMWKSETSIVKLWSWKTHGEMQRKVV